MTDAPMIQRMREGMTVGERVWLLICSTFTAGVLLYNLIETGQPW